MGCVMASYRSMLSATRTYVDAYVTLACRNFITLQATFPARHEIVIRQMMSVNTFNSPTLKSVHVCVGAAIRAADKEKNYKLITCGPSPIIAVIIIIIIVSVSVS